jgi:hypothetical protein
MRKVITAVLFCIALAGRSQDSNLKTDHFQITGLIKNDLQFTIPDILNFPLHQIGDVLITNHQGEPRGTASQLEGVRVIDLLQPIQLTEASPKRFSEFYFVFEAADGYKVVFSWNELFNSSVGQQVYLITSKAGKKMDLMEERILLLSPSDFKTGRRHIKGLSKITVKRAD